MKIQFGQNIDTYDIPVINERVARAGAGILFLFAILSFSYSFLLHDFTFTKIFITYFMIDFFIRVIINPEYAPSLILGKHFVKYQKPEWVGAPQKRWAWSFGLGLAIIMFFIVVIFEYMTMIKLFICILCLALLFSEAVFGICLGCKIYNLMKKDTQYCAGGSCDIIKHKDRVSLAENIILMFTVIIITFVLSESLSKKGVKMESFKTMKCQAGKCGIK